MLRSTVGPPGDVDWTLPWHEILHHWNERANFLTARYGLKTWSAVCLGQYWKFANYVSNLPGERWVVRALNWFPEDAANSSSHSLTLWADMYTHIAYIILTGEGFKRPVLGHYGSDSCKANSDARILFSLERRSCRVPPPTCPCQSPPEP